MDVDNKHMLTVTPLDANHCPGSVMLLFESTVGTILHTGDFRFDPCMLDHPALKGKTVDQLYLDNTFAHPRFDFPPRAVAANLIGDIIERHPGHTVVVAIDTLGKEELIQALAEMFACQVSCGERRYRLMQLLGLDACVTLDEAPNCIKVVDRRECTADNIRRWNEHHPTIGIVPTGWTCGGYPTLRAGSSGGGFGADASGPAGGAGGGRAPRGKDDVPSWLSASQRAMFSAGGQAHVVLTPSLDNEGTHAMHAPAAMPTGDVGGVGVGDDGGRLFYVGYSLHSSYPELRTFVGALRPRSVTCTVPNSAQDFLTCAMHAIRTPTVCPRSRPAPTFALTRCHACR